MNEMDRKSEISFLDIVKVSSTFISTVLIALASIYVTTQYNEKQLEIAQIKEISSLIPKLGSQNENDRKFSAIALGLYGEEAIPALIAILDDGNQEVRDASAQSIALIGDTAIPYLEQTFADKLNTPNLRGTSLWTLGLMKASRGLVLARRALADPAEDPIVRKDAATVLGMQKDVHSTELLVKVLERSKERDSTLAKNIVWSLGQIADPATSGHLLSLLSSPDESLRLKTVHALSQFKSAEVAAQLSLVMRKDTSEQVRQAAEQSLEWQKRVE